MGKESRPRGLDENEAIAKSRLLRISTQKLNLVARTIRGKPASKAIEELAFSKKRIANDVRKCLMSAVANAENNHELDVDSLVVKEAYVGKRLVMRRGRPRARGRYGPIRKPVSQLTIIVREQLELN